MVPHRSPTNTSRREQSHPHPSATFPSNAFPSGSLLFQSFPKHRILTEIASNPCGHNGFTSGPNYWQKLLLILVTIKQCLFLWLPSIPVSRSPPQMHLRGRTIKQCLFLIMVPHRGPINTSRWLQSRQHPILTEVPQKFLKQCLSL